ncbi:tetratricopeptide repeat protein [Paracrocinitomix mangrovi]|uniref:tetratricopeptide repeat protein n=1 Tax=Paracrocinitomix mangrovi TaxID=2862509 RepID=UPI001C8EE674|nr:tetratricopeptide repeat protein [Paracrocinitomix mangrovi]UKN00815.1 tetratricopeptide repeat protein [Paracrocinitomix mangrovi]
MKIIRNILFFFVLTFTALSCKNTEETAGPKRPVADPFKTTFHEAIQEKMRGNFDVAAQLFEKCLTYNNESDAVHFALSDVYEQLKDEEKAISHAKQAFEIDKNNKWYSIKLANIYYDKGDYHKAATYFEYAIQEEKNVDVKSRYAECLIYSKQYKKGIAVLDEIEVEMGVSPQLSLTKHDMYLELGDTESAELELKKLIEDNPYDMENRLIIADYFLRTNQSDKAEKVANEALKVSPNNGEIRLILADIAIRKGDLETCFNHLEIGFKEDDVSLSRKVALIGNLQQYAFEDSDEGRQIKSGLDRLYNVIYDENAENDTLFLQYGYYLQFQNKPLDAIKQFEKAVIVNPNSYDTWMQLIYTYYHIEDYKGMLKSAGEAVALFPSQPELFLLGGIAATEVDDYNKAEEWLYYGKELVINDPSLSSEFQHHLGNLSKKQKDYEQANIYYAKAKKLDEFNGNVYFSQAMCYVEEGKDDLAIKEAETAIQLAPTNPFFYDLKGLVYFKLEKYDQARKSFENALVYDAINAKILEHLGDTYYMLGEQEKAVEYWQKSMDNGGYNALLIKKLNDKEYYEQ